MKKIDFKSVAKFKYNNQKYEMFKTDHEKIAFLKINDDGKYVYPTYSEFAILARFFIEDHNKSFFARASFKPLVKEIINKKIAYLMLTSSLVMGALTGCTNTEGYQAFVQEETYIENIEDTLEISNEVIEDTTEFEETIDQQAEITSLLDKLTLKDDSELLSSSDIQDKMDSKASEVKSLYSKEENRLYLLDSSYLDTFIQEDNFSLEEINSIIDQNTNIPNEYKEFIKDYSKTMYEYYDGLDMRIYAKNLETIKFDFKDPIDIALESGGCDAFYDAIDNKIILANNIDLNNEDDMLKVRHELGHVYNNLNLFIDGHIITYYFNFQLHGKYLKEALDVLFTTNPFIDSYSDETKEKLGYNVTTNSISVLVNASNYDLKNYITGNVYDFEDYINTTCNQEYSFNYYEDVLELQFLEYSTSKIELDDEYHYDYYNFIVNEHMDTFINESMSLNEIEENKQELISLLTQGLSNSRIINIINEVTENNYNNYIELHNIVNYTK